MNSTPSSPLGALLYSGKAKDVYAHPTCPEQVIMVFRDDITAFNGLKSDQLPEKGRINRLISGHVLSHLAAAGIPTHEIAPWGENGIIARKLLMFPVEVVVRNRAAGGFSKRLGIPEGQVLREPITEFYYKSDTLNDPLISTATVTGLNWATPAQLAVMESYSLLANRIATALFLQAGLCLVDFKLEFGSQNDRMYLADEWSPDSCRLWDIETGEKFDKDRFRRDLGNVVEHYQAVAKRLGIFF